MGADSKCGLAYAVAALALAVLTSCNAPGRGAIAPSTLAPPAITPRATAMPAAALRLTTVGASPTMLPPTATALATPAVPVRPTPVELPPTPALPLAQALAMFTGDALLYTQNGFLMLTDGRHQLWLTADETVCGHEPGPPQDGLWSPDGRFLAITCQRDSAPVVAVLDLRTNQLRQVAQGAPNTSLILARPDAWAPTVPEFLITTWTYEKSQLSLVDAPTGRVTRWNLVEDQSRTFSTAWSLDGARIAIYTGSPAHGGRGTSRLYRVNADGADLHHLADVLEPGWCGELEWSRDGRFIFMKGGNQVYCYRIAADTGAAQMIPHDQLPLTRFRWSADAAWYLAWDEAASALYRADGIQVRPLARDPGQSVIDVAWLPDNRRFMLLVAHSRGGIDVVAADVQGPQTIIATYPNASYGALTIAPSGELLTVWLGDRMIILDQQGQTRAAFDGLVDVGGWRPRR